MLPPPLLGRSAALWITSVSLTATPLLWPGAPVGADWLSRSTHVGPLRAAPLGFTLAG
ncbi:hypothetical protein GCM10023198_51150 [Promicromonospora umidemergens]|uniref:Uncharacterized protein n=1 Tax=Promicromonospora umidemergens TaxID=629679 RepID=A0ABP8Y316_9MICO